VALVLTIAPAGLSHAQESMLNCSTYTATTTPSTEHGKQPISPVKQAFSRSNLRFPLADLVKLGVGGLVSKYAIPSGLLPSYGRDPISFMTFIRSKLT
jgi:hypothetical protein